MRGESPGSTIRDMSTWLLSTREWKSQEEEEDGQKKIEIKIKTATQNELLVDRCRRFRDKRGR